MPICHWCNVRKTFRKAHVIPDFIIRDLKKQSVQGALYYSWVEKFAHRDIVGPYFCRECDNHVFGVWETQFSQDVYPDPMPATHELGLDSSIKFIVTLCYRYAMHNLRVSPHGRNKALNEQFRDAARAALLDTSRLGNQLFVYPYVYRPITETCELRPGVNKFLVLGFHSRPYPGDAMVPSIFTVFIPRMIFLYSLGNLGQLPNRETFPGFIDLRPGIPLDLPTTNVTMPGVLARDINEGIFQEKNHLSG
jgi:hypothetical protein